jgi:hypothetical protein
MRRVGPGWSRSRVIVLCNEDTVTPGLARICSKDVSFRKAGDAVEVRKKGVKSFHIDPGKTAMLYFTKNSNPARETMQYPFWNDVHSHIKENLGGGDDV